MKSTVRIRTHHMVTISTLLVLAAAAVTAEDRAGDKYAFKTIARTGQSEDRVTFGTYFQPGGINDAGEISFAPNLQTGGESVFLTARGLLIRVRAAGDPLPGGATFGYTLGPIGITLGGDTAFIPINLSLPKPYGLGSGVYRTVFGTPLLLPLMLPGVTRTPSGQTLRGAAFNAQINNRYETVFPGIVCSAAPSSVPATWPCDTGKQLAFGIYQANILGEISAIVEPGSPAPGGSSFDYAQVPFNNNVGDIAFDGHVYGEDCRNDAQQNTQSFRIFCQESVYLRHALTGVIVSIAHQDQSSPVFNQTYNYAFGPVLNDFGDLVFIGNLSATGNNAVFLYAHGITTAIAKPGDPMPGGGHFKQAGGFPHTAYLNNNGEIAFIATLDDGGQGLYLWKNGSFVLVAKTGTVVDNGGRIKDLDDFGVGAASTQIAINDHGQIVFAANLTAGGGATLVATPR